MKNIIKQSKLVLGLSILLGVIVVVAIDLFASYEYGTSTYCFSMRSACSQVILSHEPGYFWVSVSINLSIILLLLGFPTVIVVRKYINKLKAKS